MTEGVEGLGSAMRIGGLVDVSTVDWYGHVAFMIFFAGCNFRCPFCQNAEFIPMDSGVEASLDSVKARVNESLLLLDALGVTGGEPVLQPDALIGLFRWAREKGLKTFLNTNGSRPPVVSSLIEEGLVDYVATDVKGPLSDHKKLGRVIGLPEKVALRMASRIRMTMETCLKNKVPLEIRTTIVPTLIDDEESVRAIAGEIVKMGGCDAYYLQQFMPVDSVLDKRFEEVNATKRDLLMRLGRVALDEGIENVFVKTAQRGVEKVI